jgi:hypothetical protein
MLMAIFMVCWEWLTRPLQPAASPTAFPLTRPALAALPAARPRLVLLATIHVPWQRLSS